MAGSLAKVIISSWSRNRIMFKKHTHHLKL